MSSETINSLVFNAAALNVELSNIRIITLSQRAFELHYPTKQVTVCPELFVDHGMLTLALNIDILDEFIHEKALLTLLNLKEDVCITQLTQPLKLGSDVKMEWCSESCTYLRGSVDVNEQTTTT